MDNMIEVKTAELIGPALDWAVALATGRYMQEDLRHRAPVTHDTRDPELWRPSLIWSHGGPLIEKYRVSFVTIGTGPEDEEGNEPIVALTSGLHYKACEGKTHLIAACRAIVAAKLGETVQVHKELVQ